MENQNDISQLKRSFIPKSLRPDVQGQYYTPEQQATNSSDVSTIEIEDCISLLKDLTIDDIKDYSTRRKIILGILTNNLDKKYAHIKNYLNIIREMFPNIPQK